MSLSSMSPSLSCSISSSTPAADLADLAADICARPDLAAATVVYAGLACVCAVGLIAAGVLQSGPAPLTTDDLALVSRDEFQTWARCLIERRTILFV